MTRQPSTDPAAQAKLAKERERQDAQDRADLTALVSSPQNRRALLWILDRIGAGPTPETRARYSDHGFDSHATAYQVGAQDVGRALLEAIRKLAPSAWLALVTDGANAVAQREILAQAEKAKRPRQTDQVDADSE